MNIGILTFHRPANFGANLQAFCSSSYLKNLGHNVSILNYVRDEDEAYASKGVNDVQLRAHSDFVCNKLPITEEVRTKEELKYLVKKYEYDLIVVGADAVWRSKPNDTIFFLQWLFEDSEINNIAAVSMSPAHMGNGFKNLTDNQR